MSQTIGNQIRELRKERRLTQAQLAEAVSVSVQAVSKWERGGAPDIDLLPAIADYFGVSIDQLFGYRAAEDVGVDSLVQQAVGRAPEGKRTARACELAFAAFKGLTELPNITDLGYSERCDSLETDCTRCRVLFEDGFAYASADETAPSVFILPEPKGGYRGELFDIDDYAGLFTLFGSRDMLQVLFYLYGRRAIPFSMQHISAALDLDEKLIHACLEKIRAFRWIEEEEVELISGPVMLYRPVLSESFMAMIYFASELLRRTHFWYLSNVRRTSALLR